MKDMRPGRCELCRGGIAEVRAIGSWVEYGGGGGSWYSGRCPTCDVDYRLALGAGVPGLWRLDAPGPDELRAEVGADELAALSARFGRYATLGPKWQAFLARRRFGDVVWRFASADGTHNGFAVVRDGRPVSRFAVLGPVS